MREVIVKYLTFYTPLEFARHCPLFSLRLIFSSFILLQVTLQQSDQADWKDQKQKER